MTRGSGESMSDRRGVLARLSDTHKALMAIIGIVAVVITADAAGFVGLPERVEENTVTAARALEAIADNTAAIRDLARGDSLIMARFDRSDCLALLDDATRRAMAARIETNPGLADAILERECP